MSNTESHDAKVVSVTSQGQATIPKEIRERLNISTPGRVRFRTEKDGTVTIEPVRDIREFRGIADSDRSLTATLHEERARDRDHEADLAESFAEEGD